MLAFPKIRKRSIRRTVARVGGRIRKNDYLRICTYVARLVNERIILFVQSHSLPEGIIIVYLPYGPFAPCKIAAHLITEDRFPLIASVHTN